MQKFSCTCGIFVKDKPSSRVRVSSAEKQNSLQSNGGEKKDKLKNRNIYAMSDSDQCYEKKKAGIK